MRLLSRWRALPTGDRARLFLFVLTLPLVTACLTLFGYRRTLGLAGQLSQKPLRRLPTPSEQTRARRLAWLLQVAGRRGLRAACLPQALLLYWWLRRDGLDPQLKLGARRTDSGPTMHAWVELHGESLDPASSSYATFQAPSSRANHRYE